MLWTMSSENTITLNCLKHKYPVPNLIFTYYADRKIQPTRKVFLRSTKEKYLPSTYLLRSVFKWNNSSHFFGRQGSLKNIKILFIWQF